MINILCSCNQHKEKATASLLFAYDEGQEIEVLDYIKTNKHHFFDGSSTQQRQRFKAFFNIALEKNSIADAINSDTSIFAMVQQITPL